MSSTNKRSLLLVGWLALLGGLYAAITHLSHLGLPSHPVREAAPQISAAEMQRRWPEIAAAAAAPPRGNPAAPYTLVEFGDFQCPQCAKMRPVIEAMLRQAPAKVNLLFVHRPFPSLHKWAISASEASEAAAAQGKFWPMYDTLYKHQDDLEPGYYGDYAASAGLDKVKFEADAASPQSRDKVSQASRLSDSLGIQLTPTLLLRDNKTGKVIAYVGADSNLPGSPAGFQGIRQLAAAPPWAASPKTARKP